MPSYTENARALKPDPGSLTGAWGSAANTSVFDILDRALGAVQHTLTGTSTTLTVSDGVLSTAGAAAITFVGTPGGAATVTLAPATLKKVWIIRNAVSDGSAVIISQGSGANVTIPAGYAAVVAADGGGVGANVVNLLPSMVFTNVQGTVQTASQPTIDHDSLANFVANEHVDHSGVAITGGVGLGGGGDITASRSIDLAINTLTAEATVDGAADQVVMYDASAAAHRRVTVNDLVAGSAGSGVASVTAGEGLANDGSASAVNLSIALEEVTTAALLGSDFIVGVTGAGAHKKQAITDIGLSLFDNDAGFLSTAVESIAIGTLGDGLDGSFSGPTGAVSLSLSLDFSEFATMVSLAANDELLVLDVSAARVPTRMTLTTFLRDSIDILSGAAPAGVDEIAFRNVSGGTANSTSFGSIPLSIMDNDLEAFTASALGFFGTTPVAQQSDPGGLLGSATLSEVITAYNILRTGLVNYGLF